MSLTEKFVVRGAMPTRARMRGLSLIELMIAMTISLIVLAAVGWIYQGTMQTYRSHDAVSRLQEGARYAFEIMGRDVRMAGAAGCSRLSESNVFNDKDEWYGNLFGRPIEGINFSDAAAAGAVNEKSDALRVLTVDVAREYIVDSHVGTTFTLTADHDVSTGQLMLVTNCNHAAVFQASAADDNTISHDAAGTPGNSIAALGKAGAALVFAKGSRLYKMNAVTYYVADNAAGVPSLFRMIPVGADATLTPEELVEGVEDMRVTFGVDESDPADGQVDNHNTEPDNDSPYVSGDFVTADGTLGVDEQARWNRVMSVRISLLMRSAEDRVIPQPQAVKFNTDDPVLAEDRHLRKVFTHVIKLRNRG
jgi:type IV pilus assembly protein PilW